MISKDKTYVLRDGEEYAIEILGVNAFDKSGSTHPLLARVSCLNTQRTATFNYDSEGYYLNRQQPHAMDLIDRDEWTVEKSSLAQKLPKLGDSFRFRTNLKVLAHVTKLGVALNDDIAVELCQEESGATIKHSVAYHFDGRLGNDPEGPFDLIEAYAPCSTWNLGDPLLVRISKEPFSWVRATYNGLDSDHRIKAIVGGGTGMWVTGPITRFSLRPDSVNVPDESSIRDAIGLPWSTKDVQALRATIKRMHLSWPYPHHPYG
jgi:hypothetical protein